MEGQNRNFVTEIKLSQTETQASDSGSKSAYFISFPNFCLSSIKWAAIK